MTIEAKLDALTAAINGLTAAVQYAAGTKPIIGADPAVVASTQKQAKEAAKPAAQAPKGEPAATAPAAPPAAPEAAKVLTYDDVKVPFLALVKKNRDLALATLKPFGLDSLKPAKPEQFAAILAALNNALAS